MALIKCSECGKEISDKAEICINCGYPLKAEFRKAQEERQLRLEEKKEKELLSNKINKISVERLYEIAHNCHYDLKDEEAAYTLYEMVITHFPNTPEGNYSKSQIDNLLKNNQTLSEISLSKKEEIFELRFGEAITKVPNADISYGVIKRQLEQRRQLKKNGADGYYEYKVISIMDKVGRTDVNQVSVKLNQMGLEGWHLKFATTNELGKNALSVMGLGVNATVDETVLIFERFIRI